MTIKLSQEQNKVFDRVMDWYKSDERTFVLAGYAGAGKTTLAKYIAEAIDKNKTVFCAYTGKAANVLREKGCPKAGTLHGFLYSLSDHDRKILEDIESQIVEARARGQQAVVSQLLEFMAEKRQQFRKPRFELNEASELRHAPLVIVDEYSMLGEKVITDLQSVASKILYIGDPFQLPPVQGECSLEPDIFIEEIHRQALDSPIIRKSTDVRQGRQLQYCEEPGFKFTHRINIDPEEYKAADQIIVGLNKTRAGFNQRFRELKGFAAKSKMPVAGDKMVCLKNNHDIGLFNGMIGEAKADALPKKGFDKYFLDFDDKVGLTVWNGDVLGESERYDGYNKEHRMLDRFDYAYAITCHKSQGSEFDNVLIYNQPVGRGEERARWLYTAITRGKQSVTLVDPK